MDRSSQPLAVLLVEDSPSDAVLLRESLSEPGLGRFDFVLAETWAEASRLLRNGHFDVLLLDLSLPDITGDQTVLRARAEAPQLPIVVLTGEEDEAVGLRAVRHGVQDYLIKAQSYGRQTARAIRYAIERKQAEEAIKQAESKLQEERDQLELRVRDRTRALSETNEALQREMAQREAAERAHRRLLRLLAQSEENERRRISRELHDSMGQDLTALKLGLRLIVRQESVPPAVRAHLEKLERVAETLMENVHRLAWELRPSVLDDLGLELACRRFIAHWSETARIPVDCRVSGLDGARLPFEVETTLYRALQEALTNAARHASPQRVSVLLERRTDCLSLIVEDDGRGFDPESVIGHPDPRGKLGLLGMRERVTLLGGMLEIESKPSQGAALFVRLPLELKPLAPEPPGHEKNPDSPR